MNFFEHQAEARRRTARLIILFSLAVITLIAITDLGIIVLLLKGETYKNPADVPVKIHIIIASLIIAVILLATTYKIATLRNGGAVIAKALGGEPIPADTEDPQQRKILNIVEEMALASGTPIPVVYLLDDSAINAFAAGHTMHDAVIGITRGSIELLNRDELQGVIAHEFSHILNGDMRLNLQLTGMLFGILFIALAGQKMLQIRSSSRHAGNLVLFGLALLVIGYTGYFFGSLIRAAINRQREYLADAAAVQFTRNPAGIGNALQKIGGWTFGSTLLSPNAAEYSHFYIACGISPRAAGFFSTHPALKDRIKRILPSWNEHYPQVTRPTKATAETPRKSTPQPPAHTTPDISTLAAAINDTGSISGENLLYAKQLLDTVAHNLLALSRDPDNAYILALGLTLHRNTQQWDAQLTALAIYADTNTLEKLKQHLPALATLDSRHRLPLINLCLNELKKLPPPQRETLDRDLKLLISADQKCELWEWALYSLFTRALSMPETRQVRYHNIKALKTECQQLLAAVAYSSNSTPEATQAAYAKAAEKLGLVDTTLPEKTTLRHSTLNAALGEINLLAPLQKPGFLKALCIAAEHDADIHINEIELIRTIAASINCPMPPLRIPERIKL